MEASLDENPSEYEKVYEYLKEIAPSSEAEYFKGLVCYLNPDKEEFRIRQAINHFQDALGSNPDYLDAKLHLAYALFDIQEFSKAMALFLSLLYDQAALNTMVSNDQMWKVVNIMEVVSVCLLRLGRWSQFHGFYEKWKELYHTNLMVSKDNFYFPRDLVMETASFLKDKGDELSFDNVRYFKKVSFDLITLIKGGEGFEKVYSKELENLRNWNGQKIEDFSWVMQ